MQGNQSMKVDRQAILQLSGITVPPDRLLKLKYYDVAVEDLIAQEFAWPAVISLCLQEFATGSPDVAASFSDKRYDPVFNVFRNRIVFMISTDTACN